MRGGECGLFLARDGIHQRLRQVRREGEQIVIEMIALGIVTISLLVYLVYALLRPEKF